MVFATQTPKAIDNKIVSNCTTHFYGKMNSPATIEAARELIAVKGGHADDIASLNSGVFYFATERSARPSRCALHCASAIIRAIPSPPTKLSLGQLEYLDIRKPYTRIYMNFRRNYSPTVARGAALLLIVRMRSFRRGVEEIMG